MHSINEALLSEPALETNEITPEYGKKMHIVDDLMLVEIKMVRLTEERLELRNRIENINHRIKDLREEWESMKELRAARSELEEIVLRGKDK